MKELRFKYLIADKGYDYSSIKQTMRDKGGSSIIPIRHFMEFHAKTDEKFMEKYGKIYAKEGVDESIFSAMKKRFGGELWSRKEELKFKEMLFIVIAYNA